MIGCALDHVLRCRQRLGGAPARATYTWEETGEPAGKGIDHGILRVTRRCGQENASEREWHLPHKDVRRLDASAAMPFKR